jgi:hypothetical protein
LICGAAGRATASHPATANIALVQRIALLRISRSLVRLDASLGIFALLPEGLNRRRGSQAQ